MGTQSLRIVQESAMKHFDNLGDLYQDHWDEIANDKQLKVLKPNRAAYERMENEGALVSLFVYDILDDIVGYSVNIVVPHIHYVDLITAHNDIIFIRKDYRLGSLGLRLIKETEKAVKLKGAQLMLWHAKENTALSKIIPRMGYNTQDIVFGKELK